MKILYAISDTHGDTYNYYKLLENTQNADEYSHLGDYSRDGSKLQSMTDKPVHIIKGNGDFSGGEDEKLIILGGARLLLTHGHRYQVKSSLDRLIYKGMESEVSAVIYGHTHMPDIEYKEGIWFICPGTLSGAGTRVSTYARIQIENGILKPSLHNI